MRTWLGTLLLIALAAGLALLLRDHSGNVLIVAQPWRIEVSLVFAVLFLIAAFILFYVLLRFLAWLVSRPRQLRSWKGRRAQRKDLELLQHGWITALEGRFLDASRDLGKLLGRTRSAQTKVLAALALARAHHQLNEFDRRDESLNIAQQAADSARLKEAVYIVQAELLLEQGRAAEALDFLQPFESSNTRNLTVTRLLLHAHHQLQHFQEVYTLTRLLLRRKAIEQKQAAPLIETATAARLKEAGADGFRAIWSDLKSDEKTSAKIALTAAGVEEAAGHYDEARKILEASLDKTLDARLLSVYSYCPPEQAAKRLARAEKTWLKSDPDNPDLLAALGNLCLISQLWGPGERYLLRSKKIRSDVRVHALLGNLYDKLGRQDEAVRHWRLASSSAGVLPNLEISRLLPAADTTDDPSLFESDSHSGVDSSYISAVPTAASAADFFADDASTDSKAGTMPISPSYQPPVDFHSESDLDEYFDSAPIPGIEAGQASDYSSGKPDSR